MYPTYWEAINLIVYTLHNRHRCFAVWLFLPGKSDGAENSVESAPPVFNAGQRWVARIPMQSRRKVEYTVGDEINIFGIRAS